MDEDIDGNIWYVHVDGTHEGAFPSIKMALVFVGSLIVQGRYSIKIQSRADWLREVEGD